MDYTSFITVEPGKRSGQPCIRGMRITVRDVLEYLAGGMTVPELLADFPELTNEDVRACFSFAAGHLLGDVGAHKAGRPTDGAGPPEGFPILST